MPVRPQAPSQVDVPSPATVLREATQALRDAAGAGDVEGARAVLDEAGDAISPRVLDRLAGECMGRRQWSLAAMLFEHISRSHLSSNPPSDERQARLRLCRNLAALQTHRPAVHEVLVTAEQASQCTLISAQDGKLTIAQTLPGGQPTCLTPGLAVDKALNAALEHLAVVQAKAYPVALLGVGDGYVLDRLAREPMALAHGCELPVYVIEPDAEVLLTCLMLHDYTGPNGPIEQARFYWAVGRDAPAQMLAWLKADAGLYPPMRTITQSVRAADLDKATTDASAWVRQRDEALKRQVHDRYASLTRDTLIERLSVKGARKPRVLLLTSRFTSVLRYATDDAARGFEANGWETRVLIEDATHGRLTPRLVCEAMLAFEPDMVFQIDHLRHELPGLFPPQLPFVCWIQDNVAQLTCIEAGESVGPHDFVLTNSLPLYTQTYHYPVRQCIYLNKLTRPVALPSAGTGGHGAGSEAGGEDLVFVSHGSREPTALAEEITALVPDPNGQRLMAAACRRLIDMYEQGGCVTTTLAVEGLLGEAEDETGVRVRDPKLRRGLVQNLFDMVNNTLYRQQALGWVTSIAESMGLSVGLYGQGWEHHPRFARWARGPVAYGDELEALTRRSKISLQIVPYDCLHQRLLDGLIAGGFFLVRLYEPEMVRWRMMRFIRERVPVEVSDYREALEQLDEADRTELAQHWRTWANLNDGPDVPQPEADPVRRLRRHERDNTAFMLDLPPRIEEVGFTDQATLEARIRRFVEDDELRQEIAVAQRQFVCDHYTYDSGLARVVNRIVERIASEPADHSPASQPDCPPAIPPTDPASDPQPPRESDSRR